MTKMITVTEKFIEEVNEVKKEFINNVFDYDMLKCMGEKEFILMKRLMGLMDTSIDIMVEQAKSMDSINEKLDLLLRKGS